MQKADQINAVELEIRGIETELKNKRLLHQALVASIDYLEREHLRLIHELQSLKNPYLWQATAGIKKDL